MSFAGMRALRAVRSRAAAVSTHQQLARALVGRCDGDRVWDNQRKDEDHLVILRQLVVSQRRNLCTSPPSNGKEKGVVAEKAKSEVAVKPAPFPKRARDFVVHQWKHAVETAKHYWLGTKLLWLDVKTAGGILRRLLTGRSLTRRERKQLLTTTADLFRVVPFAVFVIVPFLEFLLPVALWIFPGMLPSTFQDATKREEKRKAMLRARLKLTGFLGDALTELASTSKIDSSHAEELSAFIAKARNGEFETEDVTKFAKAFGDELTLDNLKRTQLVVLCRYMNIAPYGPDPVLRFQLRNAIRALRADDQRIVYEGLDSLTRQEMQEACAERGMRAVGLTKQEYRRQLGQWLELAANRQVPIALLIMSRAFTLNSQVDENSPDSGDTSADRAIADSISCLDPDVVNEAVVAAGGVETAEMRERRLNSIANQNRLIEEERLAAEEQAKEDERIKEEERVKKEEEERIKQEEAEERTDKDAPASSAVEGDRLVDDGASDVEKAFAATADANLRSKQSVASSDPSSTTWDRAVDASESQRQKEVLMDEEQWPPKTTEPSVLRGADLLETLDLKLEIAELLDVMSHLSALEREKNELEKIKTKLREGDKTPEDAVIEATGREEHPLKDVVKKDGKLEALKRKLTRMTDSLAAEIEKVDSSLGDRLHIIDRDNDGVVDLEELRDAIAAILRAKGRERGTTFQDDEVEEFVANIMTEIDVNDDGIMTVEELEKWHEELINTRNKVTSSE